MVKISISVSIVLSFILFFAACHNQETKDKWSDTMTAGIIHVACDENFKSLMDDEISIFEGTYPKAVILPTYTTETEAIRLLTDDSVRFALVTRDIYPHELQRLTEKQMKVIKRLIAFDAIAILIRADNPDSLMSLPQLKQIVTGTKTEWTEVYPQSRLGTIRLVVDNKESGVLRYLVDSIATGGTLTDNIYAVNSCAEVIEKVKQLPNAMGFVSINALNKFSDAELSQIRLLRLSKTHPATYATAALPYAGDVLSESYPLWRPIYVLLSDPKSGLSTGLTIFLTLEAGQMLIMKEGLLPMTPAHNRQVVVTNSFPK
ncbi:MAG: substrate-binding domain-containing protein [Candidatus Symbiothrix sp.]|jgi:phosphate transport system substrate-binding protein|nr:substrate-binding domain-containing protein [Candidatus Symbiothrix sp.]